MTATHGSHGTHGTGRRFPAPGSCFKSVQAYTLEDQRMEPKVMEVFVEDDFPVQLGDF